MKKINLPIEEVKKQIDLGLNITELANLYNISRPTMSRIIKENNLQTKKILQLERCKNIDEDTICFLYENGKTIKEISNLLDVSTTVIKSRLIKNNIKIRDNSSSHKKYKEDDSYFDIINTNDKAYFLGFICADGWLTNQGRLGIEVSKKDSEIIYWAKEQLQSNRPIYEKENSVGINVHSKKIFDTLCSYSIIPNKSLSLDISKVIKLANISEKYIPSFLLGYFDGDGGIYKTKTYNTYYQYNCSITGTKETCSYFYLFFGEIGFENKRHKDNKNNTTLQIGGRNQCKKALSKIYQNINDLSFYFKRKYNLYCEL